MQTYLDLFGDCRVAVIGDLMLDCYLYGEVARISPEAPVPVMRALSEKVVPGGAANVAANLASLGLSVNIVGLTGLDEARQQLIECLQATGDVDCSGIIAAAERCTTKKLRIIGAHQQIVRIDYEDVGYGDIQMEDQRVAAGKAAIDAADVVILSDYGKGVCSDYVLRAVLDHATMTGKTVLVDPKRRDLAAYRGATILTPNRKELFEATGLPCETDEEAALAVAKAQKDCGAAILLTRSEKGMSYYPASGAPVHLATVAQDVFDVSGAGDTVISVLAAAIAAKVPVAEGMRMANHAAGIVVSKMGTASVTRSELSASIAAEHASPAVIDGRLLSLDDAVVLRWSWAKDKLTVGFANGCFDLLHPGHVDLIRQAAGSCDRLIVALNTDESVRRLKGASRPIQNERARAAVIGGIKGVSAVILFAEDTPLEVVTALQPDVLIKGSDYTEDQVVGGELVRARGGRVMLIDLSVGHSTSRLVAAANATV
jgi:D-beta-D-heptose 7-phosphate kinase/D-beta-D-heptose 1-phosphate adenosyltransferase